MRFLASYLHHLLLLLRHHNLGSLSYRSVIQQESRAALEQTITSILEGGGVAHENTYSLLLVKKIILTSFELLCASLELVQEVKYSYDELKAILLIVERFNANWHQFNLGAASVCVKASHLSTERRACPAIELSSLINVYLKSRVDYLASSFSKKPSPETLLHLVQFERSFSLALLAMIATFTTLLNTTGRDAPKKRQFVSAEMFVMHSTPDNITWLDCLLPGAQSETLRTAYTDIFSRLWGRVADTLIARAQPLLVGSWTSEQFVPWLHKASQSADLERFPIVISCLEHIMSTFLQQQTLTEWDMAFQNGLASSSTKYRKCYRLNPPTPASLCSSSLDEYMSRQIEGMTPHITCDSPDSIISHVNVLRRTLPLSYAFMTSLSHVSFTLNQNLTTSMSSWDLPSLAWLLFKEIPQTSVLIGSSMAVMYGAVSPRLSFPVYSWLHSLEFSCRTICSSLHDTSTYLQETLEDFYRIFQNMWTCQCSQLLKFSFPRVKHWKNIRSKGQHHIKQSRYCDVLIEHLLFPMTDAALKLPERERTPFVYLMTTVFWGEYRKITTSNKRLYSLFAGRQLLADYRYIQRWLTGDQQLGKAAVQVLSELPVSMEIERGLLTICGTANVNETDGGSPVARKHQPIVVLPSQNFPVLTEIAWNTISDWKACIA